MAVEQVPNSYAGMRNPYNYAKVEQVSRDLMTQWLTTAEITNQLNLFDDESQDDYVVSLDLATRMMIEDYLGMSIFPTQFKVYYGNAGLYSTQVYLDLPAVSVQNQGASGVTLDLLQIYTTSNTEPVTVDEDDYSYDPTGNRVILSAVPNGTNNQVENPIVLTYTQNASPMAQYPVIKQAGLMMLTHLYNNRSATVTGVINPGVPLPYGFASLLRLYKPLVM